MKLILIGKLDLLYYLSTTINNLIICMEATIYLLKPWHIGIVQIEVLIPIFPHRSRLSWARAEVDLNNRWSKLRGDKYIWYLFIISRILLIINTFIHPHTRNNKYIRELHCPYPKTYFAGLIFANWARLSIVCLANIY